MLWWILLGIVVLAVVVLAIRPFRRVWREVELEKAKQQFTRQREHLEAKFFQLAAASGKPKGLRWKHCDFHSTHCFARDVRTARISAFVEVTIRFEAIPGGGMEDVQAVGNLRHASAVFHYLRGRWGTAGKAIFNLTPVEAVEHLSEQFVLIPASDTAHCSKESE